MGTLKPWQLVWVDTGAVAVSFNFRLIARLAAWDTNRICKRKGSARRVVVRDTRTG